MFTSAARLYTLAHLIDINRVILLHATTDDRTKSLDSRFIFFILFGLLAISSDVLRFRAIDIFWPAALPVPHLRAHNLKPFGIRLVLRPVLMQKY